MRKNVGLFLILVLLLQAMAQALLESAAPHPLEAEKSVVKQVGGPTESTSEGEGESTAEAPSIRRLGKHHSTDKSVAGGGVILGGLVTVTFAAVFCYIRVTRKRDTPEY